MTFTTCYYKTFDYIHPYYMITKKWIIMQTHKQLYLIIIVSHAN